MANFVEYKGLNYNNIGIVSRLGKVKSRNEISLEGYRIIIAGMSSIIGEDFLKEWAQLPKEIRPSIHIPRTENSIKFLELISKWNLQEWIFVGIGLNTIEIEDKAYKLGYRKFLIDIAFGGLPQIKDTYIRIRNKYEDVTIITGSIQTQEQAAYLDSLGINGLRLGVATGEVCATKYKAGVFIGSVSEIINVKDYIEGTDLFIIADGGFKYPCDISKAFLLGANYCMSGNLFKKCKSAQMHIDGTNTYFGMSSKNKGIRAGKTKYDEALEEKTEGYKTLFEILSDIWGGVRSAISYSGFSNLEESIGNGLFCKLETPIKDIDY